MAAGATPFPAAPASGLPDALNTVHLQLAFTRFAIDNRPPAADPASAPQLDAAFRDFVARPRLRRWVGGAGQTDTGRTQYPKHFVVDGE